MEYKVFGNQIVVRLDRGDEISESILKIAAMEKIALASISGIGATDDVEVGVFDTKKGTYNRFAFSGTHEITSLTGNLTTKDAEPYLHLHITLAGEAGKIVGGHLLRGIISLTAEIMITVVEGEAVRTYDSKLGINRIEFLDS